MKTKARGIIPGWPKGRSTSTYCSDYVAGDWLMFKFLKLRVPFLSSWSELKLYEADCNLLKFEFEYTRTYHQMQQAMVNEWFARYRLGDFVFQKQVYPNLVPSDQVKGLVEKGVLVWQWYVRDNEPIDIFKRNWQEP